MTQENFSLDNIRVASPCSESWEKMTGDERVRYCARCRLNVYNISEMARDEAESFMRKREGRTCVRFYKRADGTVLTSDCRGGAAAWAKKTRKRWGLVAGVVAAVLSLLLGGLAWAFARRNSSQRPVGNLFSIFQFTPNQVQGALCIEPPKPVQPPQEADDFQTLDE